jgi:hypothetical protein
MQTTSNVQSASTTASAPAPAPAPVDARYLGFTARQWAWVLGIVGGVALICAPFLMKNYRVFQLNLVMIYAVAVLGLNLLTGYSGQISLGHGAFYAVGAYTAAILMDRFGVPYWATLPIAAVLCLVLGYLMGFPALRLGGHYLALATFALALAVPQLLKYKGIEEWTGGVQGIVLMKPQPPFEFSMFGEKLSEDRWLYFFILFVTIIMFVLMWNLMRGRVGRAIVAIRDHPIAAAAMGVNLPVFGRAWACAEKIRHGAPPTRRSRSAESARTPGRPRPTARSARRSPRTSRWSTSRAASTAARSTSSRYDDGYSPPKTVEMARKLVEQDEVLLHLQRAGHAAELGDPQVHEPEEGAAAVRGHRRHEVGRSEELPVDDGLAAELSVRGGSTPAPARHQARTRRSAILYQNDDYGKDYLKGFKDGSGRQGQAMIIKEVTYEVTDPTIDSADGEAEGLGRRRLLQHHDTEVRREASRRRTTSAGSRLHYLNSVSASVGAVMTFRPVSTTASD